MKHITKKKLLIVLSVFLLALITRSNYLYHSQDNPSFNYPTVDSATYDINARNFAEGKGMSDNFFWQPFFYPFFLSVIYFLSNTSIICAKIIQIIIGAITCVLTYILGEKIFGQKIGFLAAIITIFYGPLIFFETELLASGWAAFWSVTIVLLFINVSSKRTIRSCLLLGLCGALSIITRPTFAPFFVVGCLWLAFVFYRASRNWKFITSRIISICAGFMIIAIPVAIQNLRVTGKFGIMPASGGINFYIGNNPNYKETLIARPGWEWEQITTLPKRNGIKGDMWRDQKYFYQQVTAYVRADFAGFAKGLGHKTIQFFNSREIPRNIDIYLMSKWSRMLSLLAWKINGFGFPFGFILPLAIVGLAYYWKQIPVPLKIFLTLYPFSIILVFVTARYVVPVIPFMSIVAAAGLATLAKLLRFHRWLHLIGTFVIIGVIVLISTLPGPFPEETPNYEAELYANVGAQEVLHEKYQAGESHLRKSLELMPNDGMAYAILGVALFKQDKTEEAIVAIKQALAYKPDSTEVLNNLGAILTAVGDPNKAVQCYHRSLQINPYHAKSYFGLGDALSAQNRYEEAIGSYKKAIEINPRYTRAYFHLAHAYFEFGMMDNATRYYEKTLEIDPEFNEVCFDLAWMYNYYSDKLLKEGKTGEALRYAKQAVEIFPIDVNYHIALAKILAIQNRLDEASSVLEKAIEYMSRFGNKQAVSELQKKLEFIESKKAKPSH